MGNLTRDDYKAVNLTYSSFNLPLEMDFGNNNKVNYYYDGSGKKLTKVNAPGANPPTTTEYRGVMVHQSSTVPSSLKYIITPEGRLINTGTNAAPIWGWEYDLKDHLGNVRVVFKPNADNTGVVRVEYANYFPFGMKMLAPYSTFASARYLYNGKEYQDDFGLNWYDYGARFYDAAIGRWHVIDGKAEKYYAVSPYIYAINNPIMFLDPDGKDIVIWYDINRSDGYFKFNGTNGYLAPQNSYVQNVIKAYNYNVNNGGGDNLKEAATNPDLNITVSSDEGTGNHYKGGSVYWDPYSASKTENGLFTSLATGLEHEFDHAVDDAKHPKEHKDRIKQPSNKYESMEEERVITGSERKTATKNGEFKSGQVRSSHSGTYYEVNDPTSTKFEPGVKRDANNNINWQQTISLWLQQNPNISIIIK